MYKFMAGVGAGLALLAVTFSGCSQTAGTGGGANASGTASAANVNQAAANQPGATASGGVATQGTTPAGGGATPATVAGQGAQSGPPVVGGDSSNRAAAAGRDATPKQPAPKPQIGSGGNDFFLFTQARGALGADAELKDAGLVIDLKEGVATLTGTVANDALKQKAAKLVAGVAGVKSVNNQLRVGAAGQKR